MKEKIFSALNEFLERECGTYYDDVSELEDVIPLCYTTDEDGEHEIQVMINLNDMSYEYYINDELRLKQPVTLLTLIGDLEGASFDEMIFDGISIVVDDKENKKNNELVL